jgi:hypothetical protein
LLPRVTRIYLNAPGRNVLRLCFSEFISPSNEWYLFSSDFKYHNVVLGYHPGLGFHLTRASPTRRLGGECLRNRYCGRTFYICLYLHYLLILVEPEPLFYSLPVAYSVNGNVNPAVDANVRTLALSDKFLCCLQPCQFQQFDTLQ